MTEQEAIKTIKEYAVLFRHARGENEALDIAIIALEKQIAEKPNYIGPWFECGNCKKRIEIPNNTINLDSQDYCHHCGQKLDWSEI